MIWILEFLLFAAAIGIVAVLGISRIKAGQIDKNMTGRVEAYATTIRRVGEPAHLNAMSDTELHDVLLAAAKRQQTNNSNRFLISLIASVVTFGVAIYVATSEGFTGFAITLVLGAVTIFGINQVLLRQLANWFESQELDPDRLSVD